MPLLDFAGSSTREQVFLCVVFIKYLSVPSVCVVLPSAVFVAEKAHSHVRSH